MDENSPTRFAELLQLLVRHESDFIIVGGVAALLAGAPIPTMDLDIVYDASAALNLDSERWHPTCSGIRGRKPLP